MLYEKNASEKTRCTPPPVAMWHQREQVGVCFARDATHGCTIPHERLPLVITCHQANRGKTSGQEEVGGVRLAALARGGGGGSTLLSGKEMRSYRDWELLKDKQAIESEGRHHLKRMLRYGCVTHLSEQELYPTEGAPQLVKLYDIYPILLELPFNLCFSWYIPT